MQKSYRFGGLALACFLFRVTKTRTELSKLSSFLGFFFVLSDESNLNSH